MSSPGTTTWNLGAQRRDRKTWSVIRERVEADITALQLTSVELEEILHQLLSITLPNSRIRSEEIAWMITCLTKILPLSSGLLCSEFMRFVQKCCTKEEVLFTSEQINTLIDFFLNFIRICPTWYTASSIRALGLILHENADRSTQVFEQLFEVLLRHLDPSGVDIEARYAATSCVSNICTQAGKTPEVFHFFPALLRMVVDNFRQQCQSLVNGENDRIVVKACTGSMKCIFTIVNSTYDRIADRIESNLPSLLNSMRQVVGYGLVLQEEDKENNLKCTFRDELPPHDSDSSLCGSDTNGNENRNGISGEGLLARLRITVLHTLESIAQHFPKTITSSVGLYLPEQTTPFMTLFGQSPSVLTLLLIDPCERVRIAAAKFLESFWEKIPLKQYFRHSSSLVAPSTSFASMPKRISLMLYQVHITLVYCLQNEKENTPLIQVLKTTATILQHCPYKNVAVLLDKIEVRPSLGDVLKALASSLYAVTSTGDHSVRMASLSCFSALFNIQDSIQAIEEWMISRPSSSNNSKNRFDSKSGFIIQVAHISISCGLPSNLGKRSFLEQLLVIAARSDDSSSSKSLLRLEAMSLLSKVAKNYSSALSVNWQKLSEFMLAAFQDVDPNVRLQAVKILENYIKGESVGKANSQPVVVAGPMAGTSPGAPGRIASRWIHSVPQSDGLSRSECLEFMSTHLMRAFHDTSHHVRASVCACFTLLRQKDWARLLEANPLCFKNTCIRTFLQTPLDNSPVVRAAGFRLLGSLCLASSFKISSFASSVVELALDAMEDSTLNVRVRAAWALGNVCTTEGPEVLELTKQDSKNEVDKESKGNFASHNGTKPQVETNSESTQPPVVLYSLFSTSLMKRIVEQMLVYVNDNDKVASSVARTLGLVCRWVEYAPYRETLSVQEKNTWERLLAQTMEILAGKIHSGSPKVRWNACHAIAKVLLCPSLPLASATWAPTVFQALISAITQQENFKVRISASSALRVSATRSSYGSFFKPALHATIDALETASDLKDVTEFKYKEQLETQLSFTLVHLLHVATEEDDTMIWQEISVKPADFLYDWLFHNLHRMCSAIETDSSQNGIVENNENSKTGHRARSGSGAGDTSGDGSDVHDVHPVKKEEILSAVRTFLRILQRDDHARLFSSMCLSILYDTKLSLEKDLLYSNEDAIGFEF